MRVYIHSIYIYTCKYIPAYCVVWRFDTTRAPRSCETPLRLGPSERQDAADEAPHCPLRLVRDGNGGESRLRVMYTSSTPGLSLSLSVSYMYICMYVVDVCV